MHEKIFIILFFIFSYGFSVPIDSKDENKLKVAIIGAGIGGASVSHYLAQNFSNIEITLFEKENEAGGRTNHFKVNNHVVEMGASFFIEANKNIIELAQIYNCSYGTSLNTKEILGLWNGTSFLLETSTSKYWTLAKMIWRYRLSPLYFSNANSKMVENFFKIYQNVFHNYSEFLAIIKAEQLMNITFENYLINEGYHLDYINQFVAGVISGIYNQDFKKINALAGMIAMAGANNKAYSFHEGNQEFIKKIIRNNQKIKFYNGTIVKKITRSNSQYQLVYQNSKKEINDEEIFDIIIIASTINDIEIQLDHYIPKKNVEYVETFVYLVSGEINCNYFDKTKSDDQKEDCPAILMNTQIKNSFVADYSRICKKCFEHDKRKTDIYKIQSSRKLNELDLKPLFQNNSIKILFYKEWKAYPLLQALNQTELYDIQLDDGVFYLNGMEMLASCMEMEIISGRNIVNLILENQKKLDDVISKESRGENNNNEEEKNKLKNEL